MKRSKIDVDRKIFLKFGKILRDKRVERKLTQEELADLAGIHRTLQVLRASIKIRPLKISLD